MAWLELFFFGVLASSTLVATCVMIINFPRMRVAQRALLIELHKIRAAQDEMLVDDKRGRRARANHESPSRARARSRPPSAT